MSPSRFGAKQLLNNAGQTLDELRGQTVSASTSDANSRRAHAQATCGLAYALLDIADAIREHTARTTHPAGKDHS